MNPIDAILLWLAGVAVALIIFIFWTIRRMRDEAMLDVLAMLQAFEATIEARESSRE